VTDSIRAYADQKLTKPIERHADLLRDGSNSVEVQLKVETRGRHDEKHLGQEEHIAECTVLCTNKHTIHCTASSNDMYASLDDLTDTLTRKLRKYKERKADVKQERRRLDKEAISGALIEEPDDELEGASGRAAAAPIALVRRKSFAMDPITVEDAIVCLDYIDHEFYVFRNVQTDEVNVVYKRNSGGVGLIEPERD